MTRSKQLLNLLISSVVALSAIAGMAPKTSAYTGADFKADRIIDDHIFFDGNTMTAGDIQAFLNSKVPVCDTYGTQPYAGTTRAQYAASRGVSTPFICLKDFQQDIPARAPDAYCSGAISAGVKSAAQIIKEVSVACSVSPKIMLILLQKEQSLITDDWPWPIQYRSATGYACPDTAACDSEYYGFFNQVYYGARQYQRYARQPQLFGYRYNRSNYIQYNPNTNCGGSNVFIQNQATAGLYNYTPYQPNAAALANLYGTGDGCSAYGNRNFWRMYSDWFGSTVSGICYNGNPAVKTDVVFHKYDSGADSADFLIYSGSGSGCVESHVWNPGFTSWKSHVASGQPGINAADGNIMFGDLEGNNRDYPVLYGLKNTGSGKVEVHIWEKSMRNYIVHSASNLPVIDRTETSIVMADTNGDKFDESILIKFKNTGSGMVELHGWAPGMQTWAFHAATNLPVINPDDSTVTYGDVDGDGKDEPIFIKLRNTGSGRIEFHVWNEGAWSWKSHAATNMLEINPEDAKVVFADINGDGTDEAVLVGLRNTGSGRIEFHVWGPGFTSWQSHTASNQVTTQ